MPWRLAAGVLSGALFAFACRPAPQETANTLVLGTIEEPDTLDPVFTEAAGAQEIVRLLFRDLTSFDPSWRVVPSLARALPEIETSSAGRPRAIWRLRPDLAWSDGHPLTTADVVFGHAILQDPTLQTTSRQVADEVASLRARSPLELLVEWRRSYPGLASPRVHPILPAHAYPDPAKSPAPFRGFGRTPVSSGPYRLRSWSPGERMVLERNPYWAGPRPEIETIIFRFFRSEDTFEAELRTRGIDALGEASGLSPERATGLAERLASTHVVEATESGLFLHLGTRADHPITRDLRVRRALALAIDREMMARLVYGGRATPAFGCFPPRHAAYRPEALPNLAKNATRAAQLLDEAGFTRAPGGGTRERGGERLALELELASGSQASERAATFIRSELAHIGVEVRTRAIPLRALFGRMREGTHAPLTLFAWRSGPDWDAYALLHSTGAQNYGRHSDPELDRRLEHAKREMDPARWAERLREVEIQYATRLPSIPLLFRQSVSVRPRRLEGWAPTGTSTPVTWNAERWRWRPAS